MNKNAFAELTASIREVGEIRRGEALSQVRGNAPGRSQHSEAFLR